MEIRDDLNLDNISIDDFWYDLAHGGYIKPEDYYANLADVDKIKKAVKVLQEFESFFTENDLFT